MFESDEGYSPETPTYGVFFLLKAGEAPENWSRLWTGEYDLLLPADDKDTTGGLYTPLGFPASLPALGQAFNSSYVSLLFSLSGVDAEALRLAGEDRETVYRAETCVGVIDFDSAAQPIGNLDWLFSGEAGMPRTAREGQVASISLPVVSGMTKRNLAQFQYCTPISQRLRSPDDAFFDRTPAYDAGTTDDWPT